MKRVAVAMSGGVDSSVTAGLLKQQGYDVIGITLRLWEEDPACTIYNVHACCSLSSVDDAKAVASVLGIPHYTLDFRDIFRRDVIDYFVDSYVHGKTPNPRSKGTYTTQERKKPEARETLPAFALSVYVRDFRRLSESLKSDYTLISTSTPQGSSSFMRASMVLELLL